MPHAMQGVHLTHSSAMSAGPKRNASSHPRANKGSPDWGLLKDSWLLVQKAASIG